MKLSFQADRDPDVNSRMFALTGKVMTTSSVSEGLIADDDLAQVTEVMPLLFRLGGVLRDDIYAHHASTKQALQFPVLRDCFCYAFAKGAECAFLWNQSPDGRFTMSYDGEAAIAGTASADEALSQEFTEHVGDGMGVMGDVFVDFQNELLVNPRAGFMDGGRVTADLIACGLYWAAAIGLDYGMSKIGFR